MSSPIDELLQIMQRLRDPESGCPWDQQQTFASLIPHTLEEAYEVAEAVENSRPHELADELGDLLFQVVFYARIAEETGSFDFEQICRNICDKLIRRHPHVFADEPINSVAKQTEAWEQHKARERAEKTTTGKNRILDGVSHALPALTRSLKLQKRAARVGFDWPDVQGVLDKIQEEITEVEAELVKPIAMDRMQHEVGDLLFAVVNLARHVGVDPETALRTGNRRFESRFAHVEDSLKGADGFAKASIDEMEAAWAEAKQDEKSKQ
ncbi:Nucleoside triphosphate pyrophosphohydrolase MazG [hydrothermal vent metagenome]|uniref:Nucleoside triphosphate pyrophosphohydrolase MazG n=1 Tax=hydrothermal vent metagenome TaxID=652676 RepID=A0A3B1BGI6_9ZZZZ